MKYSTVWLDKAEYRKTDRKTTPKTRYEEYPSRVDTTFPIYIYLRALLHMVRFINLDDTYGK